MMSSTEFLALIVLPAARLRFWVLRGSFASSYLFVYASAVQCLNKSTEVEIFNLRGVFFVFCFLGGENGEAEIEDIWWEISRRLPG